MDNIADYLSESAAAANRLASPRYLKKLELIAMAITDAINTGHKLMLCGNGGSAADCQHIAAEFIGRFADHHPQRMPLPAIALTTDTSALTAIGNDYSFDRIFRRQVDALGKPGDVLWCFSTSGKSPNVVEAAEAARALGMHVIGFTGPKPSRLGACSHVVVEAPANDTAVIQQLHMICAHAICGAVERDLSHYWTE